MNSRTSDSYKARLLQDWIFELIAVNTECDKILQKAYEGELSHFDYLPESYDALVSELKAFIKQNYATGLPSYSCWRPVTTGLSDKLQLLQAIDDREQRLKVGIELSFIMALLCQTPGNAWQYNDHLSKLSIKSDEGVATCMYKLYTQGLFSKDHAFKLQANIDILSSINDGILLSALQAGDTNTVIGLSNRVHNLHSIASYGADREWQRLGDIISDWQELIIDSKIEIAEVYKQILTALPSTHDCGTLPQLLSDFNTDGVLPLHNHAVLLCYSLVEVFELCDIQCLGSDKLPSLSDLKLLNFILASNVVTAKEHWVLNNSHKQNSIVVSELRALAVSLVAKLNTEIPDLNIRQLLFLLYSYAEHNKQRLDNAPILKIITDGTVL